MISLRSTGQAVLLVSAAALCILLSPPPPAFQRPLICADLRFLGSYAHTVVNCDAEMYVALAEHPSRVLEKGARRQTRPGYAVLGSILAIPFQATRPLTGNPYYAGYVMLNFVLLIGCALMLRGLTGVSSLLDPSALVPTAILLVNHITKAFLWTPHQQVMGLFVSMLSIWIARSVITGTLAMTFGTAVVVGLLTGISCLIYGAFVLVTASITLAMWAFNRRDSISGRLAATFALWVGTALPFVAWHSYVVAKTGTFYSHETQQYHQFVWMVENLRRGTLITASVKNVSAFLETVPRALYLPLAFSAAAMVLAARRNGIGRNRSSDPAFGASLTVFAVALPFYALMGFYDARLTAALIPPLVVMAGILTRNAFDERSPSRIPEPITIAAIAYVAIVILIPGPYA